MSLQPTTEDNETYSNDLSTNSGNIFHSEKFVLSTLHSHTHTIYKLKSAAPSTSSIQFRTLENEIKTFQERLERTQAQQRDQNQQIIESIGELQGSIEGLDGSIEKVALDIQNDNSRLY